MEFKLAWNEVKNGQVVNNFDTFPGRWQKPNGDWISGSIEGYTLQQKIDVGCLPSELVNTEYNEETQNIALTGTEIQASKVVYTYTVTDKPTLSEDEQAELDERNKIAICRRLKIKYNAKINLRNKSLQKDDTYITNMLSQCEVLLQVLETGYPTKAKEIISALALAYEDHEDIFIAALAELETNFPTEV